MCVSWFFLFFFFVYSFFLRISHVQEDGRCHQLIVCDYVYTYGTGTDLLVKSGSLFWNCERERRGDVLVLCCHIVQYLPGTFLGKWLGDYWALRKLPYVCRFWYNKYHHLDEKIKKYFRRFWFCACEASKTPNTTIWIKDVKHKTPWSPFITRLTAYFSIHLWKDSTGFWKQSKIWSHLYSTVKLLEDRMLLSVHWCILRM